MRKSIIRTNNAATFKKIMLPMLIWPVIWLRTLVLIFAGRWNRLWNSHSQLDYKNWWGDHTDPYGYLARWGLVQRSWHKIYKRAFLKQVRLSLFSLVNLMRQNIK